jgi:ribosomal protein L32
MINITRQEHALVFGPFGIAFCARCRKLLSADEWAADAGCAPVCPFCGEVREPVHVCRMPEQRNP